MNIPTLPYTYLYTYIIILYLPLNDVLTIRIVWSPAYVPWISILYIYLPTYINSPYDLWSMQMPPSYFESRNPFAADRSTRSQPIYPFLVNNYSFVASRYSLLADVNYRAFPTRCCHSSPSPFSCFYYRHYNIITNENNISWLLQHCVVYINIKQFFKTVIKKKSYSSVRYLCYMDTI